jgi:hypothetical protein
MISDKIRPHHLERKALLYVRQSSAHQVLHNRETTTGNQSFRFYNLGHVPVGRIARHESAHFLHQFLRSNADACRRCTRHGERAIDECSDRRPQPLNHRNSLKAVERRIEQDGLVRLPIRGGAADSCTIFNNKTLNQLPVSSAPLVAREVRMPISEKNYGPGRLNELVEFLKRTRTIQPMERSSNHHEPKDTECSIEVVGVGLDEADFDAPLRGMNRRSLQHSWLRIDRDDFASEWRKRDCELARSAPQVHHSLRRF